MLPSNTIIKPGLKVWSVYNWGGNIPTHSYGLRSMVVQEDMWVQDRDGVMQSFWQMSDGVYWESEKILDECYSSFEEAHEVLLKRYNEFLKAGQATDLLFCTSNVYSIAL